VGFLRAKARLARLIRKPSRPVNLTDKTWFSGAITRLLRDSPGHNSGLKTARPDEIPPAEAYLKLGLTTSGVRRIMGWLRVVLVSRTGSKAYANE
jgi:hypothetical protein